MAKFVVPLLLRVPESDSPGIVPEKAPVRGEIIPRAPECVGVHNP